VHFQYEKPWEEGHAKAGRLQPLIELWRAFHTGEGIPDINMLANPRGE